MTIISIYVPCALTVGWFLILLHFIWKFSSQWRHAGSGFDLFF